MSRTKDEILWLQPQPTPDSVTMNGAKAAMDEWAERESTRFGAYLCLTFHLDNNGFYRVDYQDKVYYDIQECYDLFTLETIAP